MKLHNTPPEADSGCVSGFYIITTTIPSVCQDGPGKVVEFVMKN
jgi:hypothetical protein